PIPGRRSTCGAISGAPPRRASRDSCARKAAKAPQRRSRRDEYEPGAEAVDPAPTAVTPPGSPEEAGDWMEQFFEGGRTLPPFGDGGPPGPSSAANPHPTEGQT
ncbi:sensor histidine kinase, partial [Streptomyces niveus]